MGRGNEGGGQAMKGISTRKRKQKMRFQVRFGLVWFGFEIPIPTYV